MQNTSFLSNLIKGIRKRSSKIFSNPYQKLNIGPIKHKYLKHLPTGQLRRHSMPGGVVHYTSPQELLHGLKEIFIEQLYKTKLPPDAYIIDCGANIGLSVIYFKQLVPNAKIIAFEPDGKNAELLKRNADSFNLQNVEIRQEAVWIDNTTLSFKSEGTMSSKIDESIQNGENKVQAIRLKELLNRKIDFLKIDIEGAEYEVLKDIKENLHFVQNMFFEYHGSFQQNNELLEIFDIIHGAGFKFYIKEAANVYNHPFLSSEEHNQHAYDLQLNIFCFRN